ncbi:MAG TPA: MlaD family protein [Rariglobus sp.]|nr:MlaD family protein [Rariglobus sp.]
MKTKVSPAIVGLFVLGAFVLGLIALLAFGGVNFFSKPERFIVYFDESIHGLDLGSPVKLRGVRVGRVVDFNLRYIPEQNKSVVAVVCELTRNVITDAQGNPIDVSDRKRLQGLVNHGLRAQLGVIGLATGLLFVELDFMDPSVYPIPPGSGLSSKYVDMPAVPSAISQFQSNLTGILDNMKQIDFVGLSKQVQGLLADTRKKLDAMDTGALVAQWTKAGASVEQLASSAELKDTLANMNAASVKLNGILAKFDHEGPSAAQLSDTLKDARQAIASFTGTVDTLQHFISAQQNLGDDAAQAFVRLGDAAAAVRALADYLERNPNALLTGRKPPQ